MLVLVGERIQRRSATRNVRAIVSAAAYLLLGIVATLQVIEPLPETLPRIGSGSVGGSIALVAVALAGTVLCFGLRRFAEPALAGAWIVPALALGFLPIWALPAESAVITYAGMAALLLLSRRTHLLARWMPEWVGLVIASAWWMAGAIVALAVTAPVDDLVHGWAQLGQRHGLAGLGGPSCSGGRLRLVGAPAGAHALRVRPARARGNAGLRDRRVAPHTVRDLGMARGRRHPGSRRPGARRSDAA